LKRLWHNLLAIAVIAGLFAAFEVIGTIAFLIVIPALVMPVVLARPGFRFRTAAWVASLYPLLLVGSFYATWMTAWIVLGHRPRMSLDDPKYISPIVEVPFAATYLLMMGAPGAFALCVLALVEQGGIRGGVRPGKAVAQLLVFVLLWLCPFLLSAADLFGFDEVIGWFID
jgi:hypothetical protein